MSKLEPLYVFDIQQEFFDSDAVIALERLPNGYVYANLLMNIYIQNFKNGLYAVNGSTLSSMTGYSEETIKQALIEIENLESVEVYNTVQVLDEA